jgi:5-formyltetrahydrofolate cyclo-ligase
MRAAKDELRQKMRGLRLAVAPDDATRLAELAAPHLLALSEVAAARRVALYAPIRGELDTAPIQAALAALGVACAYPRTPSDGTLTFVDATPADLVAGRHGIPEPPAARAPIALDEVDVFVVPGLAFDGRGARLGWGRGHYDRTLAGAPAALRIGLAYAFQIVPAVPADADDEHMDVVVTEAGAQRTATSHLRRLR